MRGRSKAGRWKQLQWNSRQMDRGGEGKTKYEKELVDIPGEVSACLLAGPDHGTAIGLPDPSLPSSFHHHQVSKKNR